MGCRICGRNSCTSSFHSIEEQELHGKSEDELRDEVSTLRAENESLKKDAERLNYLERSEHKLIKLGSSWYHRSNYGQPHHKSPTLRDAIDAELAKEKS